VLALPVRPPVIEETQTMKTFNQISRLALAAAALAAASGAMAANGTVSLDAATITTNGITVATVGADSYNATTGTLTAPIDAANTKGTVTDFGNADGFNLLFTVFGLPQTLAFSNFSFDTATKALSGNLVGTGAIVSKLNYLNGEMLTATSLVTSGSTKVASGFTLSTALSNYLTAQGIAPSQVSAVTGVVKSVTVPAAVPEPTTYALMGLGLVGIALVARKRQA
jgi:hypothetical protein